MATALAYPEATKYKRGGSNSVLNTELGVSSGYLAHARFVLRHCRNKAESGMDLKQYAERSGKVRTTLSTKVKAWRVLAVTDVGHEAARDNWSQLAEIHAAPDWLWTALVG